MCVKRPRKRFCKPVQPASCSSECVPGRTDGSEECGCCHIYTQQRRQWLNLGCPGPQQSQSSKVLIMCGQKCAVWCVWSKVCGAEQLKYCRESFPRPEALSVVELETPAAPICIPGLRHWPHTACGTVGKLNMRLAEGFKVNSGVLLVGSSYLQSMCVCVWGWWW